MLINKRSIVLIIALILSLEGFSQTNIKSSADWKKVSILIYTRNGKGYVHENIPYAVTAIKKLGERYGFKTETTDDPAIFTSEKLKSFTALIFASTNNDVFDSDQQRVAFRKYIEAGGGFVGLHSVVGTERNWSWFKMMIGGTFVWHPKFQKYKLKVINPAHTSTTDMPADWEKEDECYFMKEIYPGINTVIAHDLTTLNENESEKIKTSAGTFGNYYPAAWYQNFDGGIIWITALGHDKKDYEDPIYLNHLYQGLRFVVSQRKPLNYNKAYAQSKDEPLK